MSCDHHNIIMFWHGNSSTALTYIVLFPDPTPKGKGLVHIECFLDLADLACLNSVAPIRVAPCSLHVIIM